MYNEKFFQRFTQTIGEEGVVFDEKIISELYF